MNNMIDEEREWCASRRRDAVAYLSLQPLQFGQVGDWPAWHVHPYVSVWAVESIATPGAVGWWVICGDLPTDYESAAGIRGPRSAVAMFARRGLELAALMNRGETDPTMTIGDSANTSELAPLLEARATLLAEWAADDSLWEVE